MVLKCFPVLGFAAFAVCVLGTVALARERDAFDSGWRFIRGDPSAAAQRDFADQNWRVVDLPHDWSIEGVPDPAAPSAGNGGFFPTGVGWYRRHFTAPASWKNHLISVEFEGVYMNAEVWINGQAIGRHPYGYTPLVLDLTPQLKFGEDNVISVRVDNSAQPNTRWYSGSGIYRHVWLDVAEPIHFAPSGVFASASPLATEPGAVEVETTLQNETATPQDLNLQLQVFDSEGHVAASAKTPIRLEGHSLGTSTLTLNVPHPHLWSAENPSLYHVVAKIFAASGTVDEISQSFGLRRVIVSAARGLELNGQGIKLNGGSVHHDNGLLGAAAFDRAEERRVELLLAAGFNAVRTAHNPPSPAFLEACDRLGLLVIDEAFDGWEKAKNPKDYSVDFNAWWARDLEAMIRRDRNHPSVIMWSIGNEVYERGAASGARIAHEMTALIRRLDPTRPVTAGINGMGKEGDWTKTDALFSSLDVAGYNYELARHADDHVRLPTRVIMATESYQSALFDVWSTVHDFPYVVGDFVWSGMDYLGEAGIGRVFPPDEPAVPHWKGVHFPWHAAYSGDIDLTGWRKPVSHYRAIVWDRGEKLYAAVIAPTADGRPWNQSQWSMPPAEPSWTWPGQEGRPLTVEVYSRYPDVRLYLDGRLLGEKPTTRAEQFKAVFSVPYAAGHLRAVGLEQGHEREKFELVTAGATAGLRLRADRSTIRANGQDLCFVVVEAVDRHGVIEPHSTLPLEVSVKGPIALAAVGTADPTATTLERDGPHPLFQGRALVILRSELKSGPASITVSTASLPPATISLETSIRP